ncbi:MAG TPA: hypothetical protein P5055_04930 [Candidatus Paceibacterota bacterium]|nr:hypothetical protein [Candidatus Paceibacterota bacterium]
MPFAHAAVKPAMVDVSFHWADQAANRFVSLPVIPKLAAMSSE